MVLQNDYINQLESEIAACYQGIMTANSLWLSQRLLKQYLKLRKKLYEVSK